MKVFFKRIIVVSFDIMVTLLSYYLSTALTYQTFNGDYLLLFDLLYLCGAFGVIYTLFRIRYYSWKQASIYEALILLLHNLVLLVSLLFFKKIGLIKYMNISSLIVGFTFTTLLSISSRFGYRSLNMISQRKMHKLSNNRLLIYGAGNAGKLLVNEILQNKVYNYNIVGFIDDDISKKNCIVSGYKVIGNGSSIKDIVEKNSIDSIIIAMPSSTKDIKIKVLNKVMESGIENIKMLSENVLKDKNSLNKSIINVSIKDLLNRKEISFDNNEIEKIVKDRVVLITGAGGSIGSELARQISNLKPSKLLLVDINETGLYQIEQELSVSIRLGKLPTTSRIEALVGSIRDHERMESIFKNNKPEVVFHAAAHKHVPLMEKSPKEAIKNNILGTKNIIDLSIKYEVQKFINISTDKAVNPTNVMGATKRFIEMMLQSSEVIKSRTVFCAVRFGNVLGSNGSVIPLFKHQIENGGPVTVTDPEMVRYFMTIPEAVSLVLQAATYAKGGEIFVLDMGDPVKILDLAINMIKLSGYEPYKDIDIKFVGLRPGEKLYEELLMKEEGLSKTSNELIYVTKPMVNDTEHILDCIKILSDSLNTSDDLEVKKALSKVVNTYRMENN